MSIAHHGLKVLHGWFFNVKMTVLHFPIYKLILSFLVIFTENKIILTVKYETVTFLQRVVCCKLSNCIKQNSNVISMQVRS